MQFTSLIYLDPALTSLAYEEICGVSPATKIARTADFQAGVTAGLLRLGGSSKETHEFAVSSVKMLSEIEATLNKQPTLNIRDAAAATDLFLTRGNLCVGRQAHRDGAGKTLKEVSYFMLADFAPRGALSETYLDLVVHDSYFTSGYDQLAAFKDTIGSHLWEPVRTLLRPIYANPNSDTHVFAPFVILRDKAPEVKSPATIVA